MENTFICEFCKNAFSTKGSLTRHLKISKTCAKFRGEVIKNIKCEYCNYETPCEQNMKKHLKTCKSKEEHFKELQIRNIILEERTFDKIILETLIKDPLILSQIVKNINKEYNKIELNDHINSKTELNNKNEPENNKTELNNKNEPENNKTKLNIKNEPENNKTKLNIKNEHEKIESQKVIQLRKHLNLLRKDPTEHIMAQLTLKDAHIYCVLNNISAQSYGPLLEKYIIHKFGYTKNNSSNCSGDCVKEGQNIEIKVSLGGAEHNKFNYVQIRLSHHIQIYILTAYYLNDNNVDSEGELFIFRLSKDQIKNIIMSYGTYAHGTIKNNGKITPESFISENNKEYAIRVKYGDKCWNDLIKYKINDNEL
jgi:hypothetical protein